MMVTFGFLIFPDIQQLDVTGPYEVVASAPDTKIELIGETLAPVMSVTGLPLSPTTDFASCGKLDVLCVPGGRGVNALMTNEKALSFVREKAKEVRYLTSVCTGSMVLGAAGLLIGKHATSHWSAVDLLADFGAIPSNARIVRDGNMITAGGVTSGIDFGLTIIAELFGAHIAEKIQLNLQYAPEPPFHAGTPENAPQQIVDDMRLAGKEIRCQRQDIARQWREKQNH